jgi:predicted TIM-barrel fold metal-dependent hydrolase
MSKTDKSIPIVDTHQHLVDSIRFGADWAHPPVSGNFAIHKYEKAINGLNIVKVVTWKWLCHLKKGLKKPII